jgi:hypothetical protein
MVAWRHTIWQRGYALAMPGPNRPSRGLMHIKGAHYNLVDLVGEAEMK